ncbi:serine hydrolase domain-containing protein [Ornithinimicrobium faecis]|uniref:serine hydrolase domain-containing protein n=1 Tax=Ornithinimicrobium faecis TaxID=2934158 RepID=UPI002119AEBB|nr:serine hydrolase domain-containing protein [Ornithinimicrobium sp. HY1745]
MSRRRSTVLTLGVALALVLPMGAAHATEQPEPDSLGLLSAMTTEGAENDVRAEIAEAAREAGELRAASHGPQQQKAPAHELDAAAQVLVDDGAVGVTARIESPGQQWSGSAGVREVNKNPKALEHSPFRAASITKTMVATLVLQEVGAGTFTLDTPANDLVPGLFPEHPDVTVEHLLTHRSGAQTGTDLSIASKIQGPAWQDFIDALGMDYTDAEHLALVNGAEWLFEPGTDFNYSNAGYIALGMILEDATGEDLESLLQDRVFDPARMRHTAFPDDSSTRGPFLLDAMNTGTEDGGIGWVALDDFDPDLFSASGAAVTTTRDVNRFTEALISGQLVDPALVEQMIVPQSFDPMEYGQGIYRLPDPCTPEGEPQQWLYGHDGLSFGTSSIALTSADGTRQVSLAVTGRDMTAPPSYALGDLLVPMMLATC